MLTIICASLDELEKLPNFIKYPSSWFDVEWDEDWLQDEFARRLISDIDHIELGENTRISLALRGQTVEQLAGGTKNILVCQHHLDHVHRFQFMGENCYPYLFELASAHDITVGSTRPVYELKKFNPACGVKLISTAGISEVLYSGVEIVGFMDSLEDKGAYGY